MSFTEVMLRVLPPVNGQQPHIAGHCVEQRANGPHGSTDFNYIGGQSGLNLQYPKVYACAMQKTINPEGGGELPIQVNRLKNLYPDEYVELFESQGWHVDNSSDVTRMYYQDPGFANGAKLELAELKKQLRRGCSEGTYGKVVQCKPVSAFSCAIGSPSYVELQISDFIVRLRDVLLLTPNTYSFTVGQLFLSALGRAVALDESVNRPVKVVISLKNALDSFFCKIQALVKTFLLGG